MTSAAYDSLAATFRLSAADLSEVEGESRSKWENEVRWVRANLVAKGHLLRPRKRGIWEITGRGSEYLKRIRRD